MSEKNISLQLHGSNGKTSRRKLDFYPTPPEATIALMDFLKLPACYTIWEPACGDGAISKILKSYGHRVISTDIAEKCYGEGNRDFLKEDYTHYCNAIITNPPFKLSHLFIKKSLQVADTVAILCKGQYWHARARTKLYFSNPPAWILPMTWRSDFMNGEGGDHPTMEAIWTVWIKGNASMKYYPLLKPGNKNQQSLFDN